MKITVTKGWIREWDRPNIFTLEFETETEEERKALLDSMRDRKSLKVTIEEVEQGSERKIDDCDKGRICPKCGKVMVLCEDERTYNEIWECDECGYKEVD